MRTHVSRTHTLASRARRHAVPALSDHILCTACDLFIEPCFRAGHEKTQYHKDHTHMESVTAAAQAQFVACREATRAANEFDDRCADDNDRVDEDGDDDPDDHGDDCPGDDGPGDDGPCDDEPGDDSGVTRASGPTSDSKLQTWCGRVVIAPLLWMEKDKRGVVHQDHFKACSARSGDRENWKRWQIVHYDESTKIAKVFCQDEFKPPRRQIVLLETLNDAQQLVEKLGKIHPPLPEGRCLAVQHVSMELLNRNAFFLSADDVRSNSGNVDQCSECKRSLDDTTGRRKCDGCYPIALGPRFQCRRGYACRDCETAWIVDDDLRGQYFADVDEKSKRFLCHFCRQAPTHTDVWGSRVTPPNRYDDLITPGTTLSCDGSRTEQPWQAAKRARERLAAAAHERAARVGPKRVRACAVVLSAARQAAISDGQLQVMLNALALLNDEGTINLNGAIPKDIRSVRASGETVVVSESDANLKKYWFDTSGLMQSQKRTLLCVSEFTALVQEMFDDPRIPRDQWYLELQDPTYEFSDGRKAYGPEFWQCERFAELAATTRGNARVLNLIAWSDKSESASGTRHPLVISLANLSIESRLKNMGMRTLAMLPKIQIRKPKGERSERLSEDQHTCLSQIEQDSLALALTEAAEIATHGAWFMLPGDTQPTLCVVRLSMYSADKQEDSSLTMTTAGHCPRSLALTRARELEAQDHPLAKADETHPFFRTERDCRSATAVQRTSLSELERQAVCFQLEGLKKKVEAQKLAAKHGQKYLALLQLNAPLMKNLIFDGIYKAIVMDELHVLGLGIFPKFIKMIDALFIRSFKHSDGFKSYEDVHQLIEDRLQSMPAMTDGQGRLIRFRDGWWAGRSCSGAADWNAMFSQFLVCYVGDEELLPDTLVRGRVVGLHLNLYSIYKRLHARSWESELTLALLETDLTTMVRDFKWLQSLLEAPVPLTHIATADASREEHKTGNCPGRGLDIPKLMDFCRCVHDRAKYGAAAGTSTSPFERLNKALKATDRSTSRHQREDHNETLHAKINRNERTSAMNIEGMDCALVVESESDAESDSGNSPTPAVAFQAWKRGSFAEHCPLWTAVVDALSTGNSGPAMSHESLAELAESSRLVADGRTPCGAVLVRHAEAPCDEKAILFVPGNCVVLHDGRFAQIIVPVVFGKGHTLAVSFVVDVFSSPSDSGARHAEARMRWFARSPTTRISPVLVRANQVECRVHIVPLHGRAGIAQDDDRDYFIRLPGCWRRRRHVTPQHVFRQCPSFNCTGRARRPPHSHSPRPRVTCDTCARNFLF